MATRPLRGRVLDGDISLVVLDLSLGGLRAESRAPLGAGASYWCAFDTTADRPTRVAARVVYCHATGSDECPTFEIGFRFLGLSHPSTQIAIGLLVEHMTSVLEFD